MTATFPVGSPWIFRSTSHPRDNERVTVVVTSPLVVEFDSGAQLVVRAEELFPVSSTVHAVAPRL